MIWIIEQVSGDLVCRDAYAAPQAFLISEIKKQRGGKLWNHYEYNAEFFIGAIGLASAAIQPPGDQGCLLGGSNDRNAKAHRSVS